MSGAPTLGSGPSDLALPSIRRQMASRPQGPRRGRGERLGEWTAATLMGAGLALMAGLALLDGLSPDLLAQLAPLAEAL